MSNVKDLRGMKFGSLTVARLVGVENTFAQWECTCTCGNLTVRSSRYLKINDSAASCGCKTRKGNPTHGELKTPLYASWRNMRHRCGPNTPYGKRGVSVCPEWSSFLVFKQDMGASFKPGLSLDRIDNALGYSKANCRWVSRGEQHAHTSRTLRFEYQGRSLTLREASDMTGIKVCTLRARLKSGWSANDIINRRSVSLSEMMRPLSRG